METICILCFSGNQNKIILKILLTNLLNYRMKDEGKEMAMTPTEENIIGMTLLQLMFQLGIALFHLGVADFIISMTVCF